MKSFRISRLLAWWTRPRAARHPITLRAYRGFGSRRQACLFGRVFRQPPISRHSQRSRFWNDLNKIWLLIMRRGVPRAVIEVETDRARKRSRCDRSGFFFVQLPIGLSASPDGVWHEATVTVRRPRMPGGRSRAPIYIAPPTAAFVVISDIDDTVVYTGVANKLKMLWRLFFSSAESRSAFPGVGAFYRALHRGATGERQNNPMLYLSRAPWAIYDMLDAFFNLHDIPAGPVLFLRYWGMTLDHPLPRRAKDHKRDAIRRMLALYDRMPFILIGDSGQKDPEIYARIVRENPGRVLAVYIRNVTLRADRRRAIHRLAKEAAGSGCDLVLAKSTLVMAEHAARQGYIARQSVEAVEKAVNENRAEAR